MTTVFVWNNCESSAKLNKFLRGIKKSWGKDKWSHAITGHAAVSIDDDWQPPFPSDQIGNVQSLLMKYDEDRRAYDKFDDMTSTSYKHKLQMEKYEEELEGLLTDQREKYVSWWPASSGESEHSRNFLAAAWNKVFKTKFDENKAKAAQPYVSIWKDLLEEAYAPDHVLFIPADVTEQAAMLKKWKAEKEKRDGNPSYRLYYKNCSRLAARVLIAGFGSQLSMGTRMACKLRSIWTPLHVKRICLELIKKIEGAEVLKWSAWVDRAVEANALPMDAGKLLKGLRVRASVRGSSGADARYKYDDSGTLINKDEADEKLKNSAEFLVPVLGKREAHNLGYMYSLATALNDAEYEATQALKEKFASLGGTHGNDENDEVGAGLGLFDMEEESGGGGDLDALWESESKGSPPPDKTEEKEEPKGLFGLQPSSDPMDDVLADLMGDEPSFF